ncbi:MAG: bifunctional methyltransferase/pyrophosphohydrolase YabN [Anaerolineae bacterium]
MAPGIALVGLGPGDAAQLTLEAWRVLEGAREVYLRTRRHPSIEALPASPVYHSFDSLYESAETLDQVYEQIATEIVRLGARQEGVVYAVPGHPLVGETTTHRILALAHESGIPTRIVAGVSVLEPVMSSLELDPYGGLQICDATVLAQQHHPNLDPDVGALVVQVHNRHLAGDVKMTLMNLYPDEHSIKLVRLVGNARYSVSAIPLYELDRQADLDHSCTVYVPPLPQPGSLATFQDVVARLRAPGGCPWDREQTHQTLRTHLLEETYETLAALDGDDMPALKEELGDLLLQVFLHAQIATEDGDFRLIDSVRYAVEKLTRRHPHVFGGATVSGSDQVLRNWEQIKREERANSAVSALSSIPPALPALSQAMEMQRRAARVGFDWPNIEPVLDKVTEELAEIRAAEDETARAAELGDLLFSLVNVARWLEIDPESALRETNLRWSRRYATIERLAAEQGKVLENMTLEEMDVLWEWAKRQE